MTRRDPKTELSTQEQDLLRETYLTAQAEVEGSRAQLVSAWKARVALGQYQPNFELIAERMLASTY